MIIDVDVTTTSANYDSVKENASDIHEVEPIKIWIKKKPSICMMM
jgi:hypothetical protein